MTRYIIDDSIWELAIFERSSKAFGEARFVNPCTKDGEALQERNKDQRIPPRKNTRLLEFDCLRDHLPHSLVMVSLMFCTSSERHPSITLPNLRDLTSLHLSHRFHVSQLSRQLLPMIDRPAERPFLARHTFNLPLKTSIGVWQHSKSAPDISLLPCSDSLIRALPRGCVSVPLR